MRTITNYSEQPEAVRVIAHGNEKTVFVRENIEEYTVTDPEGNERTEWTAVEYSATVTANYPVDESFPAKLIEAERASAAKAARAKRNELLQASDVQMLLDRVETETPEYVAAWKAYRQALRDVPGQAGFPFEIAWPAVPEA